MLGDPEWMPPSKFPSISVLAPTTAQLYPLALYHLRQVLIHVQYVVQHGMCALSAARIGLRFLL